MRINDPTIIMTVWAKSVHKTAVSPPVMVKAADTKIKRIADKYMFMPGMDCVKKMAPEKRSAEI